MTLTLRRDILGGEDPQYSMERNMMICHVLVVVETGQARGDLQKVVDSLRNPRCHVAVLPSKATAQVIHTPR